LLLLESKLLKNTYVSLYTQYFVKALHKISLSYSFLMWIQSYFYITKSSLRNSYIVLKQSIENTLQSIDFLLIWFFSKLYFKNNWYFENNWFEELDETILIPLNFTHYQFYMLSLLKILSSFQFQWYKMYAHTLDYTHKHILKLD